MDTLTKKNTDLGGVDEVSGFRREDLKRGIQGGSDPRRSYGLVCTNGEVQNSY